MSTTSTPLLPSRNGDAKNGPNYSSYISAISNLSIQYNLSVIGIALLIMDPEGDDDANPPLYPKTESQDSLLKSSVFAGAVLGQAVMGGLGDVIGRGPAMMVTNAFTFVGALLCSLATWGSDGVYWELIGYRFLLGIGIGGKYPLSATVRAEGVQTGEHRSTEVAKGFFWQTPGVILPYLVAWILVKSFGEDKNGANYPGITEAQFRILFGAGAVPSAIVIYLTYLQFRGKKRERTGSENIVKVAFRNPQLWRKLFGTGMTWCLYDFVYYGTAFNQPDIINAVFGKDESIVENCEHNILLASMGLPGVLLAIWNLERLGSKRLMTWGFVAIGVASVALAVSFSYAADNNILNFLLTCFMVFATNWGCNVATYVLPTESFPVEVRSSFYGLSAAAGKVGAFLGGYFFKQVADAYGYPIIYVICAILSALGVGVSSGFIFPFWDDNFFGTTVRESDPYVRRSTNNTDNSKGEMISAA
mmetsp:Transcript_14633/g.27045  ORF Transcript_14633/g.27045 Transcript_14633/m.27045 type:complete len:475 (+) Transcript_14633:96-1520(+)|eukprot:CAMPEP_0182509432 /NCGR_PEP_ID=MMETSP1321-20130603/26849_1 /TAXON_ID=91990 /ORGANISM="Bolidomonas sp., Strain RCC1657" /LENGTH=474 /DNA_ID=CAMNT_0024715703 /DNA_START=40 /DNA_END=1464 /DNA_ORIENTATION=+